MGIVCDMLKQNRREAWKRAGDDKVVKRGIRKAAHGNPSRPSKRP